jgi:hypothetical protein
MVIGWQTRGGAPPRRSETPAEREERIRREAAVIAQARAEIEAGQGIGDDDLEAWLDALDHDENTPLPIPAPTSSFHP